MPALLLLAALVTAGPPWRRALGLGLALLLLPWSLALPGGPLLRAVLALLLFWGVARVHDLAREPRAMRPLDRVVFVFAVLDTRQFHRGPPHLQRDAFLKAAVWIAIGLSALAFAVDEPAGPLRWGGGAVVMYALGESAEGLLRGLLALFGRTYPAIQRTPIVARSLREFWGERWNLVVNRWLRAHCYLPLARRRQPGLGLALSFFMSAAIHAWFIGVALGPRLAACMGLYFVVQGLLLALEHRLQVTRWPAPLGRAWMLVCTLLPSPLFVEPMLRLFATPPIHV